MADRLGLQDLKQYRLPDGRVCRALMAFSIAGVGWWLIGPGRLVHLVTWPAGQVLRAPAKGSLFPIAQRCTATGWYAGQLAPVDGDGIDRGGCA